MPCLACHCGVLASVEGQYMIKLWWTKWHLGEVFNRVLRSFSVSVIRAVHRTHRFFYHRPSAVLEITLNLTRVSLERNGAMVQDVSPVSITKLSWRILETFE